MDLKLETTRREVIKPSSPAPLDRVELSMFDLSNPEIYVPTSFFYKSDTGEPPEIISQRLKISLSETLSRFYPLAGRIESNYVNCNNEGVVFLEARTDLLLSDFLKKINLDVMGDFFSQNEEGESPVTWPLLKVKVSFFGSGSGFAVCVGISHKISDAASLFSFIQGWAATANGMAVTTPTFAGVTVYPPAPSSFQPPTIDDTFVFGGNRLVFESSKITELKHKTASESLMVPTRVEAITSLIWRCATNASRSNSATPKPTVMVLAMDLRVRIPSDVLPQDAIGNLISTFFIKKGAESAMESGEIVAESRKAKERLNKMIEDSLQGYNTASTITTTTLGQNLLNAMGYLMTESNVDTPTYSISSWCKKPFYEVDFGWGTPVWVGPAMSTNDAIVAGVLLMDSKDGEGVEAWVCLPEQDMPVFVRDQELLTYAVLNPPVLI